MKYKLLKSKAGFMAYLIICLSFSVYMINPVSAAEEGNLACCEKTISGESCRYTFESECDKGQGNYNVGTFQTCDASAFCRPGCCISPEGTCSRQVGKAVCEGIGEGWIWDPAADCSIERCAKGCCVVGESQCTLTTDKRCAQITSQFEGLTKDFRAVGSEAECLAICQQADKGCCVKSDGICTWASRGSCNLPDGTGMEGFYKDTFCSNDNLACDPKCEPYSASSKTGCIEGEEDVFAFDSCGNPEGVAEECDYAEGKICTQKDEKSAYCKSVNCEDGVYHDEPGMEGYRQDYFMNDEDYYGFRKNGESWCWYDTKPGPTLDTPGSRHWKHICVNGEEIVEPCMDYREEICRQVDLGDNPDSYIEASCAPNRADCAATCNSQKDLVEDASESEKKQAANNDKRCCEDTGSRDCIWVWNDEPANTSGMCLPMVPPGAKFWSDEGESNAGSEIAKRCEMGNKECKVVWEQWIAGADYDPVKMQQCYGDDYLIGMNKYCNGLGDCGANFNYNGKWTSEGVARTYDESGSPKTSEYSAGGYKEKGVILAEGKILEQLEAPPEEFGSLLDFKDSVKGIYLGHLSKMQVGEMASSIAALSGYGRAGAAAGSVLGAVGISYGIAGIGAAAAKVAIFSYAWLGNLMTYGGAALSLIVFGLAFNAESRAMVETAGWMAAGAAVTGLLYVYLGSLGMLSATGIGTILASAAAVSFLALAWLADNEIRMVNIQCTPWQPPVGGSDCAKCDGDPMHPCSEYRCRSLGQNCRFINENEGTNKGTCYWADQNDVAKPKISGWFKEEGGKHPLALWVRTESGREDLSNNRGIEILPEGQAIEGGYKITGDKIPAYSVISFGIKTNELSQCKYTDTFDKEMTYSKLANFFADSFYSKEHNITISALMPNKIYEYYIICRDANGNPKESDRTPPYKIQFETDNSPDLTPPMIIGTNLQNGGVVRADGNVSLILYVDEDSPFECNMSRQDVDISMMETPVGCAATPMESIFEGTAECALDLPLAHEGANTFYFRCQDKPEDRTPNIMDESFVFTVARSKPLQIESVSPPPGTEYLVRNVTLQAATKDGGFDGRATCSFVETGIGPLHGFGGDFFVTNSTYHEQRLDNMLKDSYNIAISCRDDVENAAFAETNFTVTADTAPPGIAAVYKTASSINLELNEPGTCEYSDRTFSPGSGTAANADPATAISIPMGAYAEYHIICEDIYLNKMPEITVTTVMKLI